MSPDLIVASVTGGQVERYMPGDRITVTAWGAVLGGQVVELVTGHGERQVQPAGAGSLLAMGIALYDIAVGASGVVVCEGVWLLTATGAITAGQRVICAAAGTVAPAGAAPDARTLVGYALADIANAAQGPIMLGGTLG